jgi:hypothetical protein
LENESDFNTERRCKTTTPKAICCKPLVARI